MCGVSVPPVEDQVQREEGAAKPLVLADVAALVVPERVRWLGHGDDHVPERDRRVAAARQDEPCQAAVADIQEAALAEARRGERQKTDDVADRVRVVRDEPLQTLSGRFR